MPPFPTHRCLAAAAALVCAAPLFARADPATRPSPRAKVDAQAAVARMPDLAAEPDGSVGTAAAASPFAKAAAGTIAPQAALTPPVTVTANTSADALSVINTGTGRAINGTVNHPSNALSAVKGLTNGSGAGVNGVNTGTTGQGGKFQLTNAASTQPALSATTPGTGNALLGVIGNSGNNDAPAVLGQHNATDYWGIGVEGDGGYYGVKGVGATGGLFGVSPAGLGAYGQTDSGTGVVGQSNSGRGVDGETYSGEGVYGHSSTGYGGHFVSDGSIGLFGLGPSLGIYGAATQSTGIGIEGAAPYIGVFGFSDAQYAVSGNTNSGTALYGKVLGSSGTGLFAAGPTYAGYFQGQVYVTGPVTAQSYGYTSDRDQKQDFEPVDGAGLLARIAALPISAWDYKSMPGVHHLGPMAQDFRAAFGLGKDDTHIEVVDIAGVSLAAIQALQKQLLSKDERVAALEAQVQALSQAMEARLASLEQGTTAVAGQKAMTGTATP